MNDMFGITELKPTHSHRTPGFQVRLSWSQGKPAMSAEFSNEDFGSRDQALEAAVIYGERVLTKPQTNNGCGVLGVSKTKQWSRGAPSKDIYVWAAQWRDAETKKAMSCRFSELKWGAAEAFNMACACRAARKNLYKSLR